MPIVAEGDAEPNDTYVEQLTASAKAAVDVSTTVASSILDRLAGFDGPSIVLIT